MDYSHNNISPLDNRYQNKILELREVFSEHALIKTRFYIEIDWLIFLCSNHSKHFDSISKSSLIKLNKFKYNFSDKDVKKIKKIEETTNHDVKAVEYFIRDFFKKDKTLSKYIHLIHFGLTSEDINSLSYAIMIKKGTTIQLDKATECKKIIAKLANNWKNITFLSKTHGQAASPSTIGKELKVYASRLDREINILKKIKPMAKFSGATGNYHTFNIAVDSIDWQKSNKKFIKSYKVEQNPITTQIEPHDWIAEILNSISRLNNILLDLSQDMWIYISNDIFGLKLIKNEVGSSTMPHKVNPIDFENAEGNLGIANAILSFLSNKLPVSRLQRDLTDSTVLRNIGVPFAHILIAFKSIVKGIGKISINEKKISDDLDENWSIVAEAIQTILRRENFSNPYEALKVLTRTNSPITRKTIHSFIDSLDLNQEVKKELKAITPFNYTGIK
jgi:adenylosuccinate lyase